MIEHISSNKPQTTLHTFQTLTWNCKARQCLILQLCTLQTMIFEIVDKESRGRQCPLCWHRLFLASLLSSFGSVSVSKYKIPMIRLCLKVRWSNGRSIWQFILVVFYWLFRLWPLYDLDIGHVTKTFEAKLWAYTVLNFMFYGINSNIFTYLQNVWISSIPVGNHFGMIFQIDINPVKWY